MTEPEQMLQAKESLQRLKLAIEGCKAIELKKIWATKYSRQLEDYKKKFNHLAPKVEKSEEDLIKELFG